VAPDLASLHDQPSIFDVAIGSDMSDQGFCTLRVRVEGGMRSISLDGATPTTTGWNDKIRWTAHV
jgi:hypothetical protein